MRLRDQDPGAAQCAEPSQTQIAPSRGEGAKRQGCTNDQGRLK